MWEDSREMLKSFNLNLLENRYPDICPECGSADKHILFFRFDDEDVDGGVWMWCSKCHSYTHAHVVVPSAWKNPEFINEDELDTSMDYLEKQKDIIDEWVNNLNRA